MIYSKLIRPLLFTLDAETAHNLTSSVLTFSERIPCFKEIAQEYLNYSSKRIISHPFGNLEIKNPVGLAAGFDKYAKLYPMLSHMGFGYLELGTFTFEAQEGNPKPRLRRSIEDRALLNKMGFNNLGAVAASKKISAFKERKIPLGINIGKSKNTSIEEASQDYLKSLKILLPFADYITINISSPNTPNLRDLQKKQELRTLLENIVPYIKSTTNCPIFIKIAPDINIKELEIILEELISFSCCGIIISNTSIDSSLLKGSKQPLLNCGISGRPIQSSSTQLIRECYTRSQGNLVIIGVGGIDGPQQALEKIFAGASLLQIYTGYIYEGPKLPYLINAGIDKFLEKERCSLSDIIGIQK